MGRESEDDSKRYINMMTNEPINNDDNLAPQYKPSTINKLFIAH
jgi:hypothetical protein